MQPQRPVPAGLPTTLQDGSAFDLRSLVEDELLLALPLALAGNGYNQKGARVAHLLQLIYKERGLGL